MPFETTKHLWSRMHSDDFFVFVIKFTQISDGIKREFNTVVSTRGTLGDQDICLSWGCQIMLMMVQWPVPHEAHRRWRPPTSRGSCQENRKIFMLSKKWRGKYKWYFVWNFEDYFFSIIVFPNRKAQKQRIRENYFDIFLLWNQETFRSA